MTDLGVGPALLFCPADRPDRFAGAAARSDGIVLDLEDAVAPARKTAARGALIDANLDPDRVIVRVNPVETEAHAADMATLSQTDFRTIMVAKAESRGRLRRIDARFRVIALCETARGISVVDRIAALDNVIAVMWGAEDLIASLGGTSSRKPHGRYRDVARAARARVLLEAGAQGKAAIDAVHPDVGDLKGLRRDAADAAASGFAASACIHPGQVETIRAAYRPAPAEIEWAREVLAAGRPRHGVFSLRGRMVDEPVLVHARAVLRRAGGR